MIVMKFGGTSVGTSDSINSVANIVARRVSQRPVVVVSALAGVTDALIEISNCADPKKSALLLEGILKRHLSVCSELKIDSTDVEQLFASCAQAIGAHYTSQPERRDAIVSYGERFSARIVSGAISKIGIPSKAYDAWDIGMITTDTHMGSEPLASAPKSIQTSIKKIKGVPVITGFIGRTASGKITTLGRGGSDYTTAIIGGAIQAEEIQIWKEVDGVLSTDPRIVPNAKLIPELHYEEASELAYFGAKVLHPKTMLPAMMKSVPIRVVNTFKPSGKGTRISGSIPPNKKGVAKAVSATKGTTVVTLHSPDFFDGSGLMAQIFTVFEKHTIPVDVISTSVVSVSTSYASSYHSEELVADLSKIGRVRVDKQCAVVCVVGAGMNNAKVIRDACDVFDKKRIPVRMISESASGISVTFLVQESDAKKSVIALHKALIK